MAKVVNLNRARKARRAEERRRKADENALRFGRSKTQRRTEDAEAEKARRDLDSHERE